MILEEKQILRLRMRALAGGIDPHARAAASREIARLLAGRIGERGARMVFGFAPMRSEPDWLVPPMWEAAEFAFPRVEAAGLDFYRAASPDALVTGACGAREPVADAATRLAPGDADMILVPGLAFDRAGRRLGRGGGYYDRLLADPALRARRVGVCFACQFVDAVPVEGHDARVDCVVTERGIFGCQAR